MGSNPSGRIGRKKTNPQESTRVKPFNKKWTTVLYTDYSSRGVGFSLAQENPDDKKQKLLIFCGSLSLSDKQKHLPAIYGENLAIITGLKRC